MIAFGPVPSRRLGRSLGINNIPPKICTYSCVYCQLGRTIRMEVERRRHYDPGQIVRDVAQKVERAKESGEPIDYLTFVPDGEPTLDVELGREIDLLRPLGIPIAVITNSSLTWREDVRADLAKADWVSLKVDAARESVWRQIDRPGRSLQLGAITNGLLAFAGDYGGCLVTETMLVEGVNDGDTVVAEVAELVARLQPRAAYLSIPTRPPAESSVRPPREDVINRAYHILAERLERVELLIGYEGNAFAFTGNVQEDLLGITSVHPMRGDAVGRFLDRAGADWSVVDDLLARDLLVEIEYAGHRFYLRRLKSRRPEAG